MNAFQLLILLVSLILVVFLIRSFQKRNISLRRSLLWCLFLAVGNGIILFPNSTVQLAHALGIGRGVDAVVYLSILLLIVICFRLYVSIESLEKHITTLTREVTLLEKKEHKKTSDDV